jgi:hypothetical protein
MFFFSKQIAGEDSIGQGIQIHMDPHYFGNLDPHPHQIKIRIRIKLKNQDPDPHQSDKLDPPQFADDKPKFRYGI